jgi:hypothetical protein
MRPMGWTPPGGIDVPRWRLVCRGLASLHCLGRRTAAGFDAVPWSGVAALIVTAMLGAGLRDQDATAGRLMTAFRPAN